MVFSTLPRRKVGGSATTSVSGNSYTSPQSLPPSRHQSISLHNPFLLAIIIPFSKSSIITKTFPPSHKSISLHNPYLLLVINQFHDIIPFSQLSIPFLHNPSSFESSIPLFHNSFLLRVINPFIA